MIICQHSEVFCVNPHDIVRKFRCSSCSAVMMCSCEEGFAQCYWKRCCGWPDLPAKCGDEIFFAEVKASRDKLSADQRRWIADNQHCLKFPFHPVKILRQNPRTGDRNG
jgi:hypothetical protein